MNFKFFGDSWFWTWAAGSGDFESESMNKHGEYKSSLSLTKIMLQSMGHSVESFCQPGFSFNATCKRIHQSRELLPSGRHPEIWVIWVSSDLRLPHYTNNHIRPDWDFTNKDKFLKQYNEYMLWSLNLVNNTVVKDVNYIFVGGQQNLPRNVWDNITDRHPNMHLLSECILGSLMRTYQDPGFSDFGRFYLEEEFIKLIDSLSEETKLDYDLVNMIADHRNQSAGGNDHFEHIRTRLMWPDGHHLGFNGHVLFVDYLLKYCEDNNLL